MAIAERSGEHLMEPELLRLRGELILADVGKKTAGQKQEAERYLKEALNLAQERRASLWELRAAVSLCGASKSRDPVHKVLECFDKEPDTPNLRRARGIG
jgi:hypothetical protein